MLQTGVVGVYLELDVQIFLLVVWAEPVSQQEYSTRRLSS